MNINLKKLSKNDFGSVSKFIARANSSRGNVDIGSDST